MIHISGRAYALIHENRNGWNLEAFRERYSEVLERYDYVVGDWGYNQLRLKGFFRDNNPKVSRDTTISSITDYINEYCNFGCAYFVLEKQPGGAKQGEDSEINEDSEFHVVELPDEAEEAYLTASLAVAAAKAADASAPENQHVKFMPRHERDLRREQQRNSRRDLPKEPDHKEKDIPRDNRKPQGKEREQSQHQGQQNGRHQQHNRPERNDRQERPDRSERPNRSGNDRPERGERQERNDRPERAGGDRPERAERQGQGQGQGNRPERGDHQGDRPERAERNRNKQRHFNGKAPVAAASEPKQQNKGKDFLPKHTQ